MEKEPNAVPAASEPTGEDRYRQLFENSPVGILNVGLDGKPLMVNERAATSFGYATPQEFLDDVPSMLDLWVDPAERDRAAEIMLETGVLRDFEVAMKRRDGVSITLSVSANPWRAPDGSVVGLQISGIDVTDRIQAVERLEEAQAHASIAFWSWRLDTNEFVHTKEGYDILGIGPTDAKQLHIADMGDLVHPADREMVAMRLGTLRRIPGERFDVEFRVVTPAGETKWLMVRGGVHDDGIEVSGSIQDITKQKLVEEKLTELNEMKTEFVSIVAHDLKVPLTVASGYADFLQSQWGKISEGERRRLIEKIQQAVGRLDSLVAGVSEIARLEAGTAIVDLRPFDLVELVRSTVEDVSSVQPEPSCNVSVPEGLPRALGNRENVGRVVTNLLSNAFKYSPQTEPIEIDISRRNGYLQVSVRDRGPGIALSDQPKLFQKFSRLPQNGDGPRPLGTGLGLFICKSLVEAGGGTIWVDSAPSKGSTFSFTLPVATG
ncbi:MAG: ATP-binding protein [Actinomycetota bacterium]